MGKFPLKKKSQEFSRKKKTEFEFCNLSNSEMLRLASEIFSKIHGNFRFFFLQIIDFLNLEIFLSYLENLRDFFWLKFTPSFFFVYIIFVKCSRRVDENHLIDVRC